MAGASGNPRGRPKGSKNVVTAEARSLATAIVTDPKYLANLFKRAVGGKLHARMEATLWAYAHGAPPQTFNLAIEDNLAVALKAARERQNALAAARARETKRAARSR